jgi:hypothetical protein
MVHQGNVYFEHCYSADFDPRADDMQREACWNAWLAHYTRHQPAHRIDYAMRRVEALLGGEPALGLPGLSPGSLPKDSQAESELVTLEGPQAGAEAQTRLESPSVSTVLHGCESTCGTYEETCMSRCKASSAACARTCGREREICLGGCY